MPANEIKYIERQNIDIDKWNECISKSSSNLIYGYTFFLDGMSKNWDGLVLNDYEAVMPITWNSKFGIRYLYQPPFTQQLGIFCKWQLSDDMIEQFIVEARSYFNFAEINFNYANRYRQFIARPNYVLSLNTAYDELSRNYKTDLKNNLKRAAKFALTYKSSHDPEPALHQFKALYMKRMGLAYNDFTRFKKLCSFANENNMLIVREVIFEQRPVASALLLHKDSRMYLLQDASLPEARRLSANHFLIDNLIREFSNSTNTLDFEGSSLPGVAHFYKNFGAREQPYFFWYHNNLSWPVRLYKRNKYFR